MVTNQHSPKSKTCCRILCHLMRSQNSWVSITARSFTRVYGLETISLRYFNVFGPRQDPSSQYSGVISRFIAALLSGQKPIIYGDGEQSRDFTYIDNVVEANLKAAETTKGIGSIINIANGERITLNLFLHELKELTGKTDVEVDYEATARR